MSVPLYLPSQDLNELRQQSPGMDQVCRSPPLSPSPYYPTPSPYFSLITSVGEGTFSICCLELLGNFVFTKNFLMHKHFHKFSGVLHCGQVLSKAAYDTAKRNPSLLSLIKATDESADLPPPLSNIMRWTSLQVRASQPVVVAVCSSFVFTGDARVVARGQVRRSASDQLGSQPSSLPASFEADGRGS